MEIKKHTWQSRYNYEAMPIAVCERCGLTVDEILPGVPNMYGAVDVEPDCDESIVQQVHETEDKLISKIWY